ncbi:DUF3592 domain-containing protein [Guyparkeria sp.]|uniref:DUF3592 domain-containing protein n=1 Tax=Guyparkeria sp. TaxID=2035736 RepID=UPI00356B3696
MELLGNIKPAFWFHLIGGVFVLIGLIFVWVSVGAVREDFDSRRWPQTVATLQDVEVVRRVRELNEDKHYAQRVSYFADLTYGYRVADREFTARTTHRAENREDALRIAAGHQAGEALPVYYNPAQPERYRFELSSPFAGLVWLLPFAAFAGIGSALIAVGRKFFME